jgi:hypothetical protein
LQFVHPFHSNDWWRDLLHLVDSHSYWLSSVVDVIIIRLPSWSIAFSVHSVEVDEESDDVISRCIAFRVDSSISLLSSFPLRSFVSSMWMVLIDWKTNKASKK